MLRHPLPSGAALVALALLAACGHGSEPGVGGVTADEAAQLNNAAEMLDAAAAELAPPDAGNAADANDAGDANTR